MSSNKIKDENRYLYWKNHVENWRSSNLSKYQYAKENNLARTTFTGWVKRLEKINQNNFVEVTLNEKSIMEAEKTIDIMIKNDFKIRVKSDFDIQLLKQVIMILKECQ